MNPTISIIVPIYNVAQYLERCIKSILDQSFYDFELILINDGSLDNSEEICQQFTHDIRLNYHKKVNGGVSSARNLGLTLAIGKYICFVDPDDYIDKHYLEEFINNVKPSTLIIQDFNLDEGEEITSHYQNYIKRSIKLPEEIVDFISDYRISQGYLWNKIFEKEIIIKNNLTFNEKIKICQDEDFCLRYIKYIDEITTLNSSNYFYVKRDFSATTKIPPFKSEIVRLESFLNYLNFLKISSKYNSNKNIIKKHIKSKFNLYFDYALRTTLYKNKYDRKDRISSLKKLSELDKKYLAILEGKTILQKIDYFLFKNNQFHILDFILYNKSKYN